MNSSFIVNADTTESCTEYLVVYYVIWCFSILQFTQLQQTCWNLCPKDNHSFSINIYRKWNIQCHKQPCDLFVPSITWSNTQTYVLQIHWRSCSKGPALALPVPTTEQCGPSHQYSGLWHWIFVSLLAQLSSLLH